MCRQLIQTLSINRHAVIYMRLECSTIMYHIATGFLDTYQHVRKHVEPPDCTRPGWPWDTMLCFATHTFGTLFLTIHERMSVDLSRTLNVISIESLRNASIQISSARIVRCSTLIIFNATDTGFSRACRDYTKPFTIARPRLGCICLISFP